jgi:hypothetical protein
VTCRRVSATALSVEGLEEQPIENVTMRNVVVGQAKTATHFKNTKGFTFYGVEVNGRPVAAPGDAGKLY